MERVFSYCIGSALDLRRQSVTLNGYAISFGGVVQQQTIVLGKSRSFVFRGGRQSCSMPRKEWTWTLLRSSVSLAFCIHQKLALSNMEQVGCCSHSFQDNRSRKKSHSPVHIRFLLSSLSIELQNNIV